MTDIFNRFWFSPRNYLTFVESPVIHYMYTNYYRVRADAEMNQHYGLNNLPPTNLDSNEAQVTELCQCVCHSFELVVRARHDPSVGDGNLVVVTTFSKKTSGETTTGGR